REAMVDAIQGQRIVGEFVIDDGDGGLFFDPVHAVDFSLEQKLALGGGEDFESVEWVSFAAEGKLSEGGGEFPAFGGGTRGSGDLLQRLFDSREQITVSRA